MLPFQEVDPSISVIFDTYGILEYTIDADHHVTLLPLMNAFVAHRNDRESPFNKVRPIFYHALYDSHDDVIFPHLVSRIATHLRAYRLHGVISFPVPSEAHYASVREGPQIVRPLVGWWRVDDPVIGKRLDELLAAEHPEYARLRPLANKDQFAEAPDYVLLSRIGGF